MEGLGLTNANPQDLHRSMLYFSLTTFLIRQVLVEDEHTGQDLYWISWALTDIEFFP